MHKKVPVFLVLLTVCLVISFPALANPEPVTAEIETTAESAILMDYVSANILYSKAPDLELPMASVTKLMTLLLAVEAVDKGQIQLSDTIVTSEYAASMGGSQVYLEPGEEMSVEEMLISIAVGSANDCSVAVAEHIGGSEDNFVQMMNNKVKEMGLKHTHFSNTTGLPVENHYTSAYDMAFILMENLKYPLFRKLSSIYEYDLRGGEFKLWNTNKLLKWYEGTDAGKTGWTNESKYCLASSAQKNGMRLIAVVLGTPEPRSHFRESIKLYNMGFSRYQMVKLQDAGARIKTVLVNKGTVEKLGLVTSKEAGVVVPKGKDQGFKGLVNAPEEITAPIEKGQEIGSYIIIKDGQEIAKLPLVAENKVPKATVLKQMHKALNRIYG